MPRINIGSAFASAGNAAFNATLSPSFNPYANDIFFMHGADPGKSCSGVCKHVG